MTFGVNGKFRIMYEDKYGMRYNLPMELDVSRLDGSVAYIGDSNYDIKSNGGFVSKITLQPGESIHAPIKLDYDTRILLRQNKVVVLYDGVIGDERALAVCNAETPTGGTVIQTN